MFKEFVRRANNFNFRMLKEFVLISFIRPDVRKTLNIINLWHVDNIIINDNKTKVC